MATTKPRITVTLTKRQHEVISTIAELGGGSMSSFISDMLESALPTLERMAVTFQKVKQAQDQERGRFLESMDRAQAAIEPVVMETIGQFDLFLGRIEEAVADATEDAPGGRGAAGTAASAPSTNRGATPRRAKTANPTAAKDSGVSQPSRKSKSPRMPTA